MGKGLGGARPLSMGFLAPVKSSQILRATSKHRSYF